MFRTPCWRQKERASDFAAGTLALEATTAQEAKLSVVFNVCPEGRDYHGKTKKNPNNFIV